MKPRTVYEKAVQDFTETPQQTENPLQSTTVVQTAPMKCRYTKSGICANIAGFCLCSQANW
jgi:hypothetical protein